jgi:nucleotide-binding universal stress UspA family protein
MARDLRDVVNKIIVAISDDEPTSEEIAGLASDLAAFFDASVVLVYLGRVPITVPPSEGPIGLTTVAAALSAVEDTARRTLDRMAEILMEHGVSVTSRLVMSDSHHAIRQIIEEEKCDLVVLPHWESGAAQRLIRVFSPSIIEDATCPVLVLKGKRWLSYSEAVRPGAHRSPRVGPEAGASAKGSSRKTRAKVAL